MPIAPTMSRIQPIAEKLVTKSRIAPTAIRIRLTLMPMEPSFRMGVP